MKIALVAGATGLVGQQLINVLLASNRYDRVIALVRNPIANHAKLEQRTIDLGNEQAYSNITADDVYCCLGTTIGRAGSKENFRKVDYQYPLILAQAMKKNGASQYLLVSALGAKKDSAIFYNQVKGEVEDAISKAGFDALHILRPSLLLGERTEKRSGEDAAKWFYKFFGFLIPSKYKGIEASKIARAMLALASEEQRGIFIYESGMLQGY